METLEFKIDRFLKMFGLKNPDEISDSYLPDLEFEELRDELRADGLTEEQIEDKCIQAEQDEIDFQIDQYRSNLESSVGQFLTNHPIHGIESVSFIWGLEKVIVKVDSLDDLLSSIRNAINGYGLFEASSNEELVNVGPYADTREACEKLFHNLADIPEIYGTASIQRILDRCY